MIIESINESKLKRFRKSYLYEFDAGDETFFAKIYPCNQAYLLYKKHYELYEILPDNVKDYLPEPIGMYKLDTNKCLILSEYVKDSITMKEFFDTSSKSDKELFIKKLKIFLKILTMLGYVYKFVDSTSIRVIDGDPLLVDLEYLSHAYSTKYLESEKYKTDDEFYKLYNSNEFSPCELQKQLFNTSIENKSKILLK